MGSKGYQKKEESGQIIIILAVSLIVILGVAALAVDGGMLYTERRFAQNAADASSLAGASKIANDLVDNDVYYSNFSCALLESSYQDIGIDFASQRAVSNNFLDLAEVSDTNQNHGIFVDCHDEDVNNKYVDFYVTITTETPTSFLYLISDNLLFSTVRAVTRLIPQHDIGYGNAIVALNTECDNPQDGLNFSGTNEINISGGGLWSNYCIRLNGPPNEVSPLVINLINIFVDEDPVDGVDDDGIPTANLLDPSGVNIINGTLEPPDENIWTNDDVLDLSEEAYDIKNILETEYCDFSGTLTDITVSNNQEVDILPGTYGSITMTGGTLTFHKDIIYDEDDPSYVETDPHPRPVYCFANGISINGGVVIGDPVTIYIKDIDDNKSGDVSITANAEVTLRAPFADLDDFSELDGLLIFMNPDTDNIISLEGDGTSYFAGTIFNLNGDVVIGGNPSVGDEAVQEFSTQIIAKNVDIHGNVSINISFDLSNTSIVDSRLDLLR